MKQIGQLWIVTIQIGKRNYTRAFTAVRTLI